MAPGEEMNDGVGATRSQGSSRLSASGAVLWLSLLAAFVGGVLIAVLVMAAVRDDGDSGDADQPIAQGDSSTSDPAETTAESTAPADTAAAPTTVTNTTAPQTTTSVVPVGDPHVQWDTFEIELEATEELRWSDFPVRAVFEHTASSTSVTVDGFWDGDRTWRVRFAPPIAGNWTWNTQSDDPGLDGRTGALAVSAPTSEAVVANANYQGHLKVSADQRYLERADGTPFVFLGDTGWWLNSVRCPLEASEATQGFRCDDYFADRQTKGFTVIGVEMFDIHNANEGGFPFPCNAGDDRGNGDYSCLNAAHFAQLDARMQQLWDRGLVAYANVSWLVGQLPNEETTPAQAKQLGQYVMARYGWLPMVFSISGEYQYGYDDLGVLWTKEDWDSYGEHMAAHNPQDHPLTIHPSSGSPWQFRSPGSGSQSSAGEFHDSDWLDLNSIQSGHNVEKLQLNPLRVSENAALEPRKPVLHAEGFYLENALNREPVTDGQLRWQAYVPILNGSLGHIYGANGIWQMYSGGVPEDYPELRGQATTRRWWEVMAHPSSVDVGRVAGFYSDIVGDWWNLEPRREWLSTAGVDYVDGRTDPHLASKPDASLVVVYFGDGQPPAEPTTARSPDLASKTWEATWFDPRTGDVVLGGRVSANQNGLLRLPDRPTAGDWALVLGEIE